MKSADEMWQAKKLAQNFTGQLRRGCVAVSVDGKRLVAADEAGVFVWGLE